MKFELIDAEKHTSEYLLHKYWARKPHNVIANLIQTILPRGGKLLDPCCGSGVSLREAAMLGIDATGIDLNPIACLISSVLLDPPSVSDFQSAVTPVINRIEQLVKPFYCDANGNFIKYLIHKINVRCECGRIVGVDEACKEKKRLLCPVCGSRLTYNLENLISTTITGYYSGDKIREDKSTLAIQQQYSDSIVLGNNVNGYITRFCENRRILAFNGMSTDMLFTKRNFSILAEFAESFENIKDEKVKNAAKLLLTASSAQCSRLIPTRNNLKTGGPSWSIPGFWVPKEHLETNPITHIKARFKKFLRGLTELNKKPVKAETRILCENCLTELKQERYFQSYDLIFFDPPYGDSVPYVEFSTFWNAFLKMNADVDEDISISDRVIKKVAWEKYGNDMSELIALCKNSLKPDGHMLITFNNNDLRAWTCLLKSLQSNGFKCEYASYQMPAVISSKAQKAKKSSYISDIYSVYVKGEFEASKNLKPVTDRLKSAAAIRGGTISESICRRIALVNMLLYNIDYSLVEKLNSIILSLFDKKNNILVLKPEYYCEIDNSLEELCRLKASEILKNGPMNVNKLLINVCNGLYDSGMPDPTEVKEYLKNWVIEKNRYTGKINS